MREHRSSPPWQSAATVRLEPQRFARAGDAWTSPWITRPAFERAVVSWNGGASFNVELRVAHATNVSPWLTLAEWPDARGGGGTLEAAGFGAIAIDEFVAADGCRFDRVQVRLIGDARGLERVFITTSLGGAVPPGPRPTHDLALDVPPRSQHEVPPPLGARLCSPTSTCMALAYFGIDVATVALAARSFDARHRIHGNWPRAIAAAAEHGVSGCVTRIDGWRALERWLEAGAVVVASVTVSAGELTGAPYDATSGHLLVVRGVARTVLVNDPAAATRSEVRRSYAFDEFERVWFERKGGVAYVFGPAVLRGVRDAVEATPFPPE